jgi:hypothetical protein
LGAPKDQAAQRATVYQPGGTVVRSDEDDDPVGVLRRDIGGETPPQVLDGVAADACVDKVYAGLAWCLVEHPPLDGKIRCAVRSLGQAIAEEDNPRGRNAQ